MSNPSKKRIQDKGTRLLAFSLILPICAFLVSGYLLMNYIVSEKDSNNLRRLAQTVRQLDNRRMSDYQSRHQVIADSLWQKDAGTQREQYLERVARNNNEIHEAFVVRDSADIARRFGWTQIMASQLIQLSNQQNEGAGFVRLGSRTAVLTFTRKNDAILILLWRFAPIENIYQHSLKNFEIIDVDYDGIMMAPLEKYAVEREQFREIYSSPDQVLIEKEKGGDLTARYFLLDIYNKPLSIVVMRTERYFINQVRRLFWMGGAALSLLFILLAYLFSRVAANYIMNPIERLSREMNHIAGDPVRSAEISLEKYPQLELLISSFNGILHSFQSYYGSVLKYQTIVTNLQEGIFWSDEDGRIIISNAAFLRIFEQDADNLSDLFAWEPQRFYQRVSQFFEGREFDIGERSYLLFVNEITVDGRPNYLGLISEITWQKEQEKARKKLELELAKARTLADLGLLIEGISHNLNGPLHNILGYVHLMLEDYPDSRDLNRIQANGIRMAEIIKSLMNRVGEEVIFAPRPIDINELVQRELEFFDHNLYFKNIVHKEVELNPNLPQVMAVYSDISQSVANLISNAVDALKDSEEKVLRIQTGLCAEGLCITVQDTGVGIPPDKLETIFEPFYSTKAPDETAGRGLGLSISRQLLSAYNARIDVVSEAGHGSTFRIVIPEGRFATEQPV